MNTQSAGTTSSTLTVSEAINQQPLSSFQITTIILCGLVLVLDGFNAQSAGTLGAAIAEGMHIPIKTMGPVFSASLFGIMVSAMIAGPVADRWGRKWLVVISVVTFAIFSILTARATSFNELLTFRFFTGVGLGAALPTVVSIAAEYSPEHLERTIIAMLFAGMPLGGFVCSVASTFMVHRWGWQSVFYLGGLFPLVMSLVLLIALPESARFLAIRGGDPKRIAKIMARISPKYADGNTRFMAPRTPVREGMAVKRLFTDGRAPGTLLLWVPFFMNLLLLFFMVSWLPALLRQSGASIADGVMAATAFNVGGIIGSLVEGPLMNAFGAFSLLTMEFLGCALLIGTLAYVSAAMLWLVFGVAFIIGFCVVGGQAGITAVAAGFYPTSIRSTGIGWALGIGRIGSIVGPMIAGFLLVLHWTPRQVFLTGAIPAVLAAVAVLASYSLQNNANAYRRAPLVASPVTEHH